MHGAGCGVFTLVFLAQEDVLPAEIADQIIDCMRAYGATTLGVVANVRRPNPDGRAILGFISYGYAQTLLRLDRVNEYLLFLYSHRFHNHSRGSWTAGEVSGVTGGTPTFCISAQQTIPQLIRWMLVSEDSDHDRPHFGRALPSAWVASGKRDSYRPSADALGTCQFFGWPRTCLRGQQLRVWTCPNVGPRNSFKLSSAFPKRVRPSQPP
jgi:hypothetical protein